MATSHGEARKLNKGVIAEGLRAVRLSAMLSLNPLARGYKAAFDLATRMRK